MSTSVSLRKSLRSMPVFRSLSGRELDVVIDKLTYKQYKAGDVLWRSVTQLDICGFIQRGEVVVEYRFDNSLKRSKKVSAGKFVKFNLSGESNAHATIYICALTDVTLIPFCDEQLDSLISQALMSNTKNLNKSSQKKLRIPWGAVWSILTTILILLFSWSDIVRILAGALVLASNPVRESENGYQKSMELIKYAETLDQSAYFAHNQEGYFWVQQNNIQSAETAFENALSIYQANSQILNNLGVTYFVTSQKLQATELQTMAVQNDPNNAWVRYNMGIVYLEQGDTQASLREFKEASYIDPDWVYPFIQQGFVYIKLHDYENAKRAAQQAIQIDDSQQSAFLILSIAFFNQGENQDALRMIERAIQIAPSNFVAKFYKALILRDLGNLDEAQLLLQQLLDATDDPKIISRITAEIESLNRSSINSPSGTH